MGDSNMQYGCLCDVGFRGVDCSEVECPTSYDPMDQETCDKYADWEDLGTTGVGNVVLIVEFDQEHQEINVRTTIRLTSILATVLQLATIAPAEASATKVPASASVLEVSQAPLVRKLRKSFKTTRFLL